MLWWLRWLWWHWLWHRPNTPNLLVCDLVWLTSRNLPFKSAIVCRPTFPTSPWRTKLRHWFGIVVPRSLAQERNTWIFPIESLWVCSACSVVGPPPAKTTGFLLPFRVFILNMMLRYSTLSYNLRHVTTGWVVGMCVNLLGTCVLKMMLSYSRLCVGVHFELGFAHWVGVPPEEGLW